MAKFELERLMGSRRAEAAFLALCCVLSIAYRGWGLVSTLVSGIPRITHISYDGVYYAAIARNLLAGHGPGWEAMTFPVLQPVIVACISYFTGTANLSFLAQCVSLVSGALLLVPAYLLAKELFGLKAAAATVLILIPYPQLAAIATGDTAESLYSFFVYLSLLTSFRALRDLDGRSMFIAGASIGLAYLARPEGLMIFEVVAALAAWRTLRAAYPSALKGATVRLGLFVAGFSLFALPYAAFLTDSYGRVVLSPKLPYESVVMKSKVFGDKLTMHEVDGIAPTGRLMWQETGGANLVFGYFRDDPVRFVRVYMSNLASELPWCVPNSSHMQGYPIVYPLYFWIPAIIGFWLLARPPDTRWKALLIWAPFVNLLLYPVFTKGFWVYHVPYVPGLVILAAGGYLFISRFIKERASIAVPLLLVVTVLSAGYSAYVKFSSRPAADELVSYRTLISDESMKAGQEARVLLGSNAVYMMNWSRLVYYLGGRWVNLPAAQPHDCLRYGVANGADYLVEELVGDAAIMGPNYIGTPGLTLAFKYSSVVTPYSVLVWRIEKPLYGVQGGASGVRQGGGNS